MPSPRASSPPSRPSCSTVNPGTPGSRPGPPSSSTSRSSTIANAAIPPSATLLRPSSSSATITRHQPPDPTVYRSGSTPGETVELIRSSGKSVGEVCRDLDLTETAVRRWLQQAEIDAGKRPGLTTAEREELARLRREVLVLREEREILKKAAAFFAKETTR